ncbi:MAG TPA: flagellar hook-basal body complex protein FliE [Cellvibrionaceae bacterium]|nr:flagellar hook-basal body complex protein FliE [Cellvibrionaceae bacterium]HMW70319.1 flagellar hook-basal body complex protein FliE [Cellvibrionaceae bacterium]HNG58748.1 flagellar hook-basal body complex protein FliE [Cellvibrionaceae bacterium]
MVDRVDINRLLLEMRTLKSQTQAFGGVSPVEGKMAPQGTTGVAFGDVMSQAVNKVNEVQQASSSLSESYIRGDRSVDISDVMIASQKASVAFSAMTQVRNKLVDAYKDIMNMPV